MKSSVDTEFVCTAETLEETTSRPGVPVCALLITTAWMLGSSVSMYASAERAQLDSASAIISTASLLGSVAVLISLLANILRNRCSLPRTVMLSRRNVSCTGPLQGIQCSLNDCCWYEKRCCIIVQMPMGDVACGLTPRAKEAVCAFLEGCGIRQLPSQSLTFSFLQMFLGITIGAGVGLVGYAMLWLLGLASQSPRYWLYWGAMFGMYLGWWHATFPYHWRIYRQVNPLRVFFLRALCVFWGSMFLMFAVRDARTDFHHLALLAVVIGALLTWYQRWRYRAFDLDWKASSWRSERKAGVKKGEEPI